MKQYRSLHRFGQLTVLATLLGVVAACAAQTPVDLIVEGVKKEFNVESVVVRRKPASSRPATDEILDELAEEADLVISAMAD